MAAKCKEYHDYTIKSENEMDDDPRKQFYMLSSSYAYRGGCGGEGAGIETFPHMLAALESQLSWLIDFKQEPFPGNE